MQQQDTKHALLMSGFNHCLYICDDFHMKIRPEDSHCAIMWSGGVCDAGLNLDQSHFALLHDAIVLFIP